tara:strand:+ start:435 stop:551 length:117 start_codon:yes stop_codon:yes gene_type:complete
MKKYSNLPFQVYIRQHLIGFLFLELGVLQNISRMGIAL